MQGKVQLHHWYLLGYVRGIEDDSVELMSYMILLHPELQIVKAGGGRGRLRDEI